jgi:hypothetical protein
MIRGALNESLLIDSRIRKITKEDGEVTYGEFILKKIDS